MFVTLTSFTLGSVVTMDFVKIAILNEEVRRQTQQASSTQLEVLVTENKGRTRDQGKGHRGKVIIETN